MARTQLPGPKARLISGHLVEFRADRLGFFARCAREYGDAVALRILTKRLILFSAPHLIEQVLVTESRHFIKHFGLRIYKPLLGDGLVTSEGDFWRRQRKLSAPAFQASRLAAYAPVMVDLAQREAARWETGNQQVRDVHEDLMRLTLEIACRTLFGAEFSPDPELVGRSMDGAIRAMSVRFSRPFPYPEWLPLPSNLRLHRHVRSLNGIVLQVIERQRGGARGDEALPGGGVENLLSILLRARDDDGSIMTDRQLLDEAQTLFLAGHETTALALTYALYLLASNPSEQETLCDELRSVLGGRPPRHEDLPNLPFTRSVVSEALRLYPPADVLGREAIADCTIDDILVRRGTTIFISPWAMHRDSRYFADPDSFKPARWTEAFEHSLPRFAYFPFGGGPRFCIGQGFALTEIALVLALMCQKFHFAPDPSFRLELWPGVTLRPRAGVRLVVRTRSAAQHS